MWQSYLYSYSFQVQLKIRGIYEGGSNVTGFILAPLKETIRHFLWLTGTYHCHSALVCLAFMVIELGSLLVEAFTERRKVKVNVSALLDVFQDQDIEGISRRSIAAICFGASKSSPERADQNRSCRLFPSGPGRRLLAEELHYVRITNRTDLWPVWGHAGLMATLIPLGPGLLPGQGDQDLADSCSPLLTYGDGWRRRYCSISRLRKGGMKTT